MGQAPCPGGRGRAGRVRLRAVPVGAREPCTKSKVLVPRAALSVWSVTVRVPVRAKTHKAPYYTSPINHKISL